MRVTILLAALAALATLTACTDVCISDVSAPAVLIVEPATGAEAFHDEEVAFCARVTDELDALGEMDLGLVSDLDGPLWSAVEDGSPLGGCEGSDGVALTMAGLSPGIHTLTMWAINSRGADTEASVTLTVTDRPNDPPACAIDEPLAGTIVMEGTALLFAGTVDDPDQAPETLSLVWESDEDGLLDSGPADSTGDTGFDVALAPGDHMVSLTVTDDRGVQDVCFVLVGIDPCQDLDGDGVENCEADCDDHDAEIYPDATELADGEDNDCDGTVDEGTVFYDDDGDGYCEGPASCTDGSDPGDCDDTSTSVYPGAPEDGGAGTGEGNGIDDDCDGLVDEGTLQYDDDGDGYSELDGDCDDADPSIRPGAIELCNGVDDDCNGTVDDADLDVDGYVDTDCGGDDCDDGDPYAHPDAIETCDGVDEDCNGVVDDRDIDGDGQLDDACGGDDCDDLDPLTYDGAAELPDTQDNDCDGVVDEGTVLFDDDGDGFAEADGDCDDGDVSAFPGAIESCGDGVDEDCSGIADDADLDGDGFVDDACGGNDCDDGDAAVNPLAAETCGNGVDDDCSGSDQDADEDLDGFVSDACGGDDCDDADPGVNPAEPEVCGNGVDEDCSGDADDLDVDGDGYDVCTEGDCDDHHALTYPGAPEVYDLVANDCDGSGIVDEGLIPYGALVVVEVMVEPAAVSQSSGEWFEVANVWHLPVNLHTWTVADLDGDGIEVDEPAGVVIDPGEVAVLCADADAAANGGVACDGSYARADLALDDAEDELILELGGETIDTLAWDGDFPLFAGAALNLDPVVAYAELNDLHGNWCEATDAFGAGDAGTPGDVNPACSTGPVIAGVVPEESVAAGGEAVVIDGSGFTATTAVTVDGNPCVSWQVVDDATLECVVPAGAVGFVDVVVEHGVDVDTLTEGFLYTGQAVTELSWCNLQFPTAMTLGVGEVADVYGRFHAYDINGVSLTDPAGSLALADPDHAGQVGYGPASTDPRIEAGWVWFDGDYYDEVDTNEEYVGELAVDVAGSWSYAVRFTDDGGFNFLYCDGGLESGNGYTPGTSDGFQIDDLGELTVQ